MEALFCFKKKKKKRRGRQKWKRKPGGAAQLERGDPESDGQKGFAFCHGHGFLHR